MLKILGTTIQNLVEHVARCSGYVHPCLCTFFKKCKLFRVIYGLAVKRVMVSQKYSDYSGTNPASCLVCTGFLTLKVMPAECESDNLPPRAKVKNEWSYTSTPPCCLMACAETTLRYFQRTENSSLYFSLMYDVC